MDKKCTAAFLLHNYFIIYNLLLYITFISIYFFIEIENLCWIVKVDLYTADVLFYIVHYTIYFVIDPDIIQ